MLLLQTKTQVYILTYLPYIMKTINETFTEEEFKMLLEAKKKLSWHNFIMKLKDYFDDQNIEQEKEVEKQNGTGQFNDGYSDNGISRHEFRHGSI